MPKDKGRKNIKKPKKVRVKEAPKPDFRQGLTPKQGLTPRAAKP